MSAEQNKAVLRRYFEELWNNGNLAVIDECIAPGMSLNQEKNVTLDKWRQALSAWLTALPDFRYHVDLLIAEGDIVAAKPISRARIAASTPSGRGDVTADRKLHRYKGVHFLSPCRRQDRRNVGLLGRQDVRTSTRRTATGFYRQYLTASSVRHGRPRAIAQVGQHGRHPPVDVWLLRQAELGEDGVHVLLDR